MQSRKQPSFIIRHSTAVHFIAYASAIFVMTPFNSKAMPVFVWIATLIACAIIISSRIRPLTLLQRSRMDWDEYKKIAGSTLMSSLLFFASCVAFKYFAGNGLEIPVTLGIGTVGFIYYSITLYLDAVDDDRKKIAKKAFTLARGLWLIISFICYILARKVFMDVTDVTYEATFNKITSFGFFLIFCTLFFSMVFLLFTMILPSLQNSSVQFNALAICAPLFCAGYIFFIAYNVNTSRVLEYVLNVTIDYDTRDTFYCNNEYRILNDYPNARFMMVGEGNYRVFTPKKHDYGIWRLTCKNVAPFYTLVEILDRKDLVKRDTK
ncbi:hypothetical protein [Enterobacter sp. UNJFSC 003]|uniref:hypothetical protein n=1 Tax=Enterobacter sp. UNJFSC 003 TaxID=3122077 RepID=UPI002ECA830B|nr:hypothetical protein [Serratia liquefaciens]